MTFQTRIHRLLLLIVTALSLAGSVPVLAQGEDFGYDGPKGLRGKFRAIGGEWQLAAAGPDFPVRFGQESSPAPLDGFTLNAAFVQIEYQALLGGSWQPWIGEGKPAGVRKKPIEGIKVRVGSGSVRYRVSSLSAGFGSWIEDGDPAQAADRGPINALEVQWRSLAAKGATLEFRALFSGHPITPWLKGGAKAEIEKATTELIGLEIRNGHGIRYEVILNGNRWQPTMIDGEQAGDATGKRRITAFRIFGGASPVRYRIRNQGSAEWSPWFSDGAQCGESGANRPIEAVQIEPNRTGP